MKKISLVSVVVAALFSFVLISQVARGPGGGARGASRGSSRPVSRPTAPRQAPRPASRPTAPRQNQNINRSPAMSRPLPTIPHAVQRPAQIASSPRPTVANQAQVRNETRQFSQAVRAAKVNTPANFSSTFQSQTRAAANASNLVVNSVRGRFPNSNRWFNDRFFDSHRSYDFFRHPGANWWWAPAWGSVATWLPYGWQDPYYYYWDAGTDPGYVQFSEPEMPIQNINEGVVTTDAGAWMPLGVFAAGVDETDAAYSNFFFQLAVDKSGQIAGTFYNAATDEAKGLAGTIDPKTQQAVWMVSDNPNSPVMMTGLYNLTKDATPVQVYFDDEPQSWTLVRVNK